MNPKKPLIALLLLLVLGWALTPALAAPAKRKQAVKRLKSPANLPAAELLEIIRRAQESADAAQAEARRAREQSAELQRQLAANSEELAHLKTLVAELKRPASTQAARAPRTGLADAEPPDQTSAPPAAEAESAVPNPEPQTPNLEPNYEERLARLEEQAQVNTAQIKEHAQTKVESDGRFRVKLYGMVLVNAYLNTNDSPQRAAPQFAPPPGWSYGYRQRNLGATARQTTAGLLMDGARLSEKLGRARVSAEAEFDLYGGSADDYGAALGALRMRTGSVRLDWERTSVVAGLREPLISPRNPSSLAAVYYPALSDAGNLWQWRPQVYAEHRWRAGEANEVALQGGVILPFGETVDGIPAENAPAYEARAAFQRSLDSDRKLVFGVGGHFGRRDFLYNRKVGSYAVTTDWLVPLGSRFELSGEAFFGHAMTLGEQSGAKVERHFALSGLLYLPTTRVRGVHAFGGWAQLNYKARRDLDFNVAWGREDPRNRDLFDATKNPATRFRNETWMSNFIYQLRSNVMLSLEYRRLWTDYAARRQVSGHYNLAIGYVF